MIYKRKFHQTETKIYLVIWVSAVVYAIIKFTIFSQRYFQNHYDPYEDFTSGLSVFGDRKRDKADFEWETIVFFINKIYPATIVYLFFSETTRLFKLNTKHTQYFQVTFSTLYLAYYTGYKTTLIILFQPILFTLSSTFNKKIFIWICNSVCLFLIAVFKKLNASEVFLKQLGINHYEAFINVLILCWMNLKCTSFYLSELPTNYSGFLSYCLYFPTVFTGPFIPYDDFKKIYRLRDYEDLEIRLGKLGYNVLRCLFWLFFGHFCLHYVYINATSFQIELVKTLDLCSLCGYGYLMGQFFHIKYVILYGLTTSLASFENIPVPSLPRCIGRIHLYSDMWKYFDPGLYSFLKTCIFIPSKTLFDNKLLSSFLCFFFVYVWHGIEDYILIWATLNFVGVSLETLANYLYENKLKHVRFVKKIGDGYLRRIKCVLAAPLLGMSAVSNFYFFAGKDVGDVFVLRSIQGLWPQLPDNHHWSTTR